jgi:hypothetical protein
LFLCSFVAFENHTFASFFVVKCYFFSTITQTLTATIRLTKKNKGGLNNERYFSLSVRRNAGSEVCGGDFGSSRNYRPSNGRSLRVSLIGNIPQKAGILENNNQKKILLEKAGFFFDFT